MDCGDPHLASNRPAMKAGRLKQSYDCETMSLVSHELYDAPRQQQHRPRGGVLTKLFANGKLHDRNPWHIAKNNKVGAENMRILVIEDDEKMSAFVAKGLTEVGHVCDTFRDGRDGLFQATQDRDHYDVLIVDRMLPGLDGLSLVRAARAAQVKTPVLFLTAMGGVDDRVEGLEAGADDYLVKPFAFSELLARLNALARRPPVQEQRTVLKVADLELDLVRRKVQRAGQHIDLQPREFVLLEALMRAEGRVLTRTMLLEKVWDIHFDPQTSVVETHISRLRTKIDKPFEVQLLHTVRNTGYSLHAPS
jgi:two-component system OmpR family response regulator